MSGLRRVPWAVARSPILWGAAVGSGFFGMVHAGLLGPSFFQRYCAGHPVEYVETYLFFVGLAALLIKAWDVTAQRQALAGTTLGPVPEGGQAMGDCAALLAGIDQLSPSRQADYLLCRLRDGVEYVFRRDSAEGLDEHLKHLSDLDAERAHGSYGLVRLIVWAIPILGFLGTVIGITMAIASLKPSALEESMVEVTAGLGVAFDTTALALALSIVLMFVQHYVDRAETGLLADVDRRAEVELVGRFPQLVASSDGQLAAVQRMGQKMTEVMEQLLRRQADLWRASLDTSQERWSRMADDSARHLQSAMAGAVGETLKVHSREQAEARRFEETLTSLAAAIHLLNARLGDVPRGAAALPLERTKRTGQAA